VKLDACFKRVLTPCISGLIASNKGARINTLDKDEEQQKLSLHMEKGKTKPRERWLEGGGDLQDAISLLEGVK